MTGRRLRNRTSSLRGRIRIVKWRPFDRAEELQEAA
jgi:hypothetical protein